MLILAIPDNSIKEWSLRYNSRKEYVENFYSFMTKSPMPKNMEIIKKDQGVFIINKENGIQIALFSYVAKLPIVIFYDIVDYNGKNYKKKLAEYEKEIEEYILYLDQNN